MVPARPSAPEGNRIALLGLLCRYGPKYGYELRSLIKQQNIPYFADIQYGSIYALLKRMTRTGLIAEANRSRSGNRPERVTYEITEVGKKELQRLMADALVDGSQPKRPVDLALHFSGLLPIEEVIGFLRARRDALNEYRGQLDRIESHSTHDHPGVLALIEDISAHFRLVNDAERVWTELALRRMESGGYPTPGRTLEP